MSGKIHVEDHDTEGKKVGVLTAVLAVLLSIFTINAHRAHTETIELQNETNNQWSHYQGKRIRDYQLEMNLDLLKVLPSTNSDKTSLIKKYTAQHEQYSKELASIKNDATHAMHENIIIQKKALYYDFAEGVLEISLVMGSLYFISRKKLFPLMGCLFGGLGTLIGIYGIFL